MESRSRSITFQKTGIAPRISYKNIAVFIKYYGYRVSELSGAGSS
jgi:hypothetical protein